MLFVQFIWGISVYKYDTYIHESVYIKYDTLYMSMEFNWPVLYFHAICAIYLGYQCIQV